MDNCFGGCRLLEQEPGMRHITLASQPPGWNAGKGHQEFGHSAPALRTAG